MVRIMFPYASYYAKKTPSATDNDGEKRTEAGGEGPPAPALTPLNLVAVWMHRGRQAVISGVKAQLTWWRAAFTRCVVAPICSFGLVMTVLTVEKMVRCHCDVYDRMKEIYDQDARVRWVVDRVGYWKTRLYNDWMRISTEPWEDTWLCMGQLEANPATGPSYTEYYAPGATTQDFLLAMAAGSPSGSETGTLWIHKTRVPSGNACYHVRCAPTVLEFIAEPTPSRVRFLSVEYCHPAMNYRVPLDLPNEMYYTGNHLFTPAFVARMLEYTVGKGQYVFDMNYQLHFMDIHLQYFTLHPFQWIELDKTLYITHVGNTEAEGPHPTAVMGADVSAPAFTYWHTVETACKWMWFKVRGTETGDVSGNLWKEKQA